VDNLSLLPINFDGIRMQADEEYGNIVWDKHFGNHRKVLDRQKRSFQLGGLINPFISLQNASMGFAASDNLHHQVFLRQVETYRRDFIKALNDEHAFGGSRTGDWGWKADRAFFISVPDFEHQPIAIASVLPTYLMDMALLLLWASVVCVLIILGAKNIKLV